MSVGLLRSDAQVQASFPLPAIDPPKTTASHAKSASTNGASAGDVPGQGEAGTAAGGGQKQGVAKECADLLQMATALKSEVDKSTKDMLSVSVVRKADQIEQLAHKVRAGDGKI